MTHVVKVYREQNIRQGKQSLIREPSQNHQSLWQKVLSTGTSRLLFVAPDQRRIPVIQTEYLMKLIHWFPYQM